MPKYYAFKIAGYFLYFTSKCIIEAFHVHASDSRLTEQGSAKLFVRADGTSRVMERGSLNDRDFHRIQRFISNHYQEMYFMWSSFSDEGFYRGE